MTMNARKADAASIPPSFVSLSEALSWIAFGRWPNQDLATFIDQLPWRESDDDDVGTSTLYAQDAQVKLEQAIAKLTEQGALGSIRITGRYTADRYELAPAEETIQIDPIRFHDYAQFCPLSGSLLHGRGLAWRKTGQLSSQGKVERRAFEDVRMKRDDLLALFPGNTPRAGDDGPIADTLTKLPGRRGRPRGGGFIQADAPIVEKMRAGIESGEFPNRHAAGVHYAGEAKGTGSLEAKARRLAGRLGDVE